MTKKVVYDPTPERKNNRKKVKREAKGTVTAATEQEIGTQATEPKKEKAEKPKAKPKFTAISDDQFIAALRGIGKPATSREISDALGFKDPDKGRGIVRGRMKKLIKEGKVKAEEPKDEKTRAKQLYNLP